MSGASQMQRTEQEKRQDQEQPQGQMQQKHRQIEGVLQARATGGFQQGDGAQIDGIDRQQGEQEKHQRQQTTEFSTQHRGMYLRIASHHLRSRHSGSNH